MIKKLFVILIALFVIFKGFSEDNAKVLLKGEVTPFSGILISEDSLKKLKIAYEENEKRKEIIIIMNKQISDQSADLVLWRSRYAEKEIQLQANMRISSIDQQQIKLLQDELKSEKLKVQILLVVSIIGWSVATAEGAGIGIGVVVKKYF